MRNFFRSRSQKSGVRSQIIILISVFCLLSSVALAQYSTRVDTMTVASSGTLSDAYDLETKKLLGFDFPATMTSDTVFIKTSPDTVTANFSDVYYTQSTGTRIRAHIVVSTGDVVGFPHLWSYLLQRYIKLETDDAEGGVRYIKPLIGNF